MFAKIGERLRRLRRRRSMRMRRGGRRPSRRRSFFFGPALKIGALGLLGIGFIAVIIFVVVPLFGAPEAEDTMVTATPAPTATPIARADMTSLAKELVLEYKSINDPYVFGDTIAFSTGNQLQASPTLELIALYDMSTQETTIVDNIEKKYAFLFEPKVNDNFIVYLDCKEANGGAVCGYDRATGDSFVIREYLFGKPKVSLAGEYALWLQQTGKGTDRLYLYHLPTRETVEIEVFVNTMFSVSAPYMSDNAIVYVQPKGESQVLDNSSSSTEAEICVIPLRQGGDTQRILFTPNTYVFEPMIEGSNIVYLDSNRDGSSRLMLCKREGNGYAAPIVIAEGVVNYAVGDGFVTYTQDEAVYIYYFKDASVGRLSPDVSRALLANAKGKDVVWYDITQLGMGSVVFHARVP